ncbi:MAG: DnaA N-terminal domain-containing protein [Caldilineaceae bacterium]
MSAERILNEIWRILDADLPSATISIALRLVRRASPDNGQVNLTWDEFISLCGGCGGDNARRHLIRLSQKKLIHYSTNDNVYVTWLAWLMEDMSYDPNAPAKNARESAKNARESANFAGENFENDAPAKNARESAKNARESAKNARESANFAEINISSSSSNSEGYSFRPELIALSRKMLRECGIFPADAETFARSHAFEELREHVFAWKKDPRATGPGALKSRIVNDFHRKPLGAADYTTSLYWQYRTPEEIAADANEMAEAEADEAQAAPPTPDPAPANAPGADLWRTVKEDLELQMRPNAFNAWIRDTWVVSAEAGLWSIGLPSIQAKDWLENRLSAKIQRLLSLALGAPTVVQFIVSPQPRTEASS